MNTEIAEAIKATNMYELATKTLRKVQLDSAEKEIVATLDKWAREIGKTGHDKNHEIAAFVQRVVEEEFDQSYAEILDRIFDRGSVGEFDVYEAYRMPKNTLKAIEAAQGGNVDRSFLDISMMTPVYRNLQVESDISFADLRRNGWKTVALISEYAVEALQNAMFADIFGRIDAGIASGAANYITEATTKVTAASADALALYLLDLNKGDSVIVGLSKYIQQMSKLTGFDSDAMRNEVHTNGFLGVYDSIPMLPVSSTNTLNNDGITKLIPDNRVFGVAGKIGTLDMKGDVHTYEEEDINNERIHIKIADFTYGYAFNDTALLDCAKIVVA